MNFIHKNKIYIGIIFGTLLPLVAYIIIRLIYDQNNPPSDADPYRATLLLERVSIFANLAGFYYFLNRGHYRSVRGIVVMTFILALAYAIVYLNRP